MNLVALIAAITALVAAVGGVLHSLGVGRNVAHHLAMHRQLASLLLLLAIARPRIRDRAGIRGDRRPPT